MRHDWTSGADPAEASRLRADAEARVAGNRGARQAANVDDRVDRLVLLCAAMWSLLQEKTGLTEAELEERVTLLDEMDGVRDGKATRTEAQTCSACGRPWSQQHQRCLYCGGGKTAGSVFDRV